jgi:DNA-binding CsgD family transcriptional regulator/AcrR family transcriptional regulator/tetratricopeptide (TPR) repeat protein
VAATVEEIAERAGVSKPVVYQHFGGKEGIYAVVVDREVRPDRVAGGAFDSDPSRLIAELPPDAFLGYIEEHEDGFRVLVRDAPNGTTGGSFASVIADVAARAERLLVEEFSDRGLRRGHTAPMYALMLVGAVALVGSGGSITGPNRKGLVAAHVVNLLWNGLRGLEPGPPRRADSTGPPTLLAMALIERDREFEALDECLKAARAGEGRLVVVQGEAGIGKTSLVRGFLDAARGVKVMVGSCDPLATPRPLGPVLDMAAGLAVVGGAPVGADTSRDVLFERFHAELASRSRTNLVVIEDVHWADDATLDLIRFVGRRLGDVHGVVVLTARSADLPGDHPLRVALGDLATAPGVRRIDLRPLTRAGVETLADELAVTDVDLDRLHDRTRGNPFLVTEALLAGGGEDVPLSVRDAVAARVARLPERSRRAVEAASVVPTRVETGLVATLADVGDAEVDVAVTAGLLRDDLPGSVAFRHELARLAVEADLPPARRSALHADVVRLLIERHGDHVDAARVAHHAELAGQATTARTYAVRAARRAAEFGARREAAEQWRRALRHADGAPTEELVELWEGYARAAGQVDEPLEMRQATERLVALRRELGDPVKLGDAMFGHSLANWHAGDPDVALHWAEQAVGVLEQIDPTPALADARAHVGSVLTMMRRLDEVDGWVAPALELAEELDAERAQARSLNTLGTAKLLRGDVDGAEPLERSVQIAQRIGLDDHAVLGWMNLGSAAGEARLYDLAEPALRTGRELAESGDIPGYVHYLTAWVARMRFEQGDWEQAERELARIPLDSPGQDVQYRLVAVGVLGRLHARRGDGAATRYLEDGWALVEASQDLPRRWHLAAGRAEAAWLAGDEGRIPEVVADTFEVACERGLPWAMGELGSWLWRAGRLDRLPEGAAAPYALQVEGKLREAAAAWETIGCPYEAAEALADGDDPDDLRRALETFDRLGAEPMAARVRRTLRRIGVRDVPKGPKRATAAHPAGLTPRQAEVLDLLDQGLTDAQIAERLFISPKTAGHHVSAILGKLDVATRAEAAHVARRRGLL